MHYIKRKLFNIPKWVSSPTCVQLDTHNYCNLNCLHCNVKQGGSFNLARSTMPDTIFLKVLEYFRGSRVDVATFMNGEPLMEPRLDYFNNMAGMISKSKVILDTNGTLYEHRYKLLNPYLKTVRITINSYLPDTYELIHGARLLEEAKKTLAFVSNRKRPGLKLSINHIVNKHNFHELDGFLEAFRGYRINVFPTHYAESQTDALKHKTDAIKELFTITEDGKTIYPNRIKRAQGQPCQCFNILGIGPKGEIMQCVDFPASHNYGTIYDTDILTAWKERLKNGMDNECCKSCSLKFNTWRAVMNRWKEP